MAKIHEKLLDTFFGTADQSILNETTPTTNLVKDLPREVSESVIALKKAAVVNDTGIDYSGLRNKAAYRQFTETTAANLRKFDLADLKTRPQRLAFWINLYNLLTIDAVIKLGVQKSITEGWFGVIRFFRWVAYEIGGGRYSLEDIKHGILRANRGLPFLPGKQIPANDKRLEYVIENFDARIHFALNCASKSCPPIAFYSAERIDAQLDLSAANFINGETRMDKSGVMMWISRIFKWYKKDFGGKEGVLEMLLRYLPPDDMRHKLIENFGYKVMMQYAPYDWRLNRFDMRDR